jgi:DNA transformation protein and related proteins
MNPISSLPNIGKELERQLNKVGIQSAEELKIVGSENAFIRLKTIDPGACINSLYAIEGAIQSIRWHNLDSDRKRELLDFFRKC